MRFIVREYLECARCPLSKFRRNIVFGRGCLPARILFVGEAPGVSEDLLGIPFIGPSGRILDRAIATATQVCRLKDPPSFFISNCVACRPTDIRRGPNRQPEFEEFYACWPRLEKTHSVVSPRRVVLLGKVAQGFLARVWPEAYRLPHPAFILRSGGVTSPHFRAFVRDLSAIFKEVTDV